MSDAQAPAAKPEGGADALKALEQALSQAADSAPDEAKDAFSAALSAFQEGLAIVSGEGASEPEPKGAMPMEAGASGARPMSMGRPA